MRCNAKNERVKRKYLIFLKPAKRQNEASIDAVAKALVRFESHEKYKDFRSFHFEQAISFNTTVETFGSTVYCFWTN